MATGSYEKFNTRRATVSPTITQLAWAAGIVEGEGSLCTAGGERKTLSVRVPQKDLWVLLKLQEIFGGSIRLYTRDKYIFLWTVSGSRARGVAYTLYSFLSPRRRAQIQLGLSRETLKGKM